MKKFGLLFALLATTTFATEQSQQPKVPEIKGSSANSPMLQMEVFKQNSKTKAITFIEGRKISRSKKDQYLCWIAFNMPFEDDNNIEEMFTTPKKANFNVPKEYIESSKDKKMHTIRSTVKSNNKQNIERCWQFNSKDPIGIYTLTIKVNNIAFPTQSFEMTK